MSLRLLALPLLALATAALAACTGLAPGPGNGSGAVQGVVSDSSGPIAGATVRLRGALDSTTTDASGRFTLSYRGPALHQVVTAWKEGYYPAGADLTVNLTPSDPPSLAGKGDGGIGLTLKPHPTADDPTYQWLTSEPDPNVALGCGHCMAAYDEWKLDAHALSATNARFLSVYNGTDLAGEPAAGPGFRLDSPTNPGNCANCHAPAAALAHSGSADVNGLSGVEAEGVFCDLCHKIDDVTLDAATGLPYQGLPGAQAYRLYRPAAGTQIFFGTLDDIPRRVSYSQLEKESRFCAPCHSGGWWGVPAYASYDEWLASPYATEGVTCQSCHMPSSGRNSTLTSPCAPAAPDLTGFSNLSGLLCRARACVECHRKPAEDPARDPLPDFTLIPERPAETIHTHRMTGVTDEAFMRSSVAMTVTATQGPDGVLAEVAITNVAAGHHIPTDSPMRNMILVVTARDAQGHELSYLGDQIIPDWGGSNSPSQSTNSQFTNPQSTNYAGLPGKGFAKVLEDWNGTAPAPQWRNGVRILSDNRIPARATDVSQYTFTAPPSPDDSILSGAERSRRTSSGEGGEVTVSARLIFRRAFKPWMDAKGWNEPDLVLAETTTTASKTAVVPATLAAPVPLFPPSLATTADGQRLVAADVVAAQECIACHPDAGGAWHASAHAEATTGPLYHAWFKAADQDTQGRISAHCAGCHTPVGLLSGQVRSRWAWSGRELYRLDAAAQEGVSCDVCHSIAAILETSNGGYMMDKGRMTKDGFVIRHSSSVTRQRELVRTPEFCASCHEATNPDTGLPVMTTYTEWQRSRFNTGDPATATTCQSCHFADGQHAALRDEDLRRAVTVALLLPESVKAGDEAMAEVRISNVGAGHDFPTGVSELRQVWLAIAVTDAVGRVVYSSGQVGPYGDAANDTTTYGVRWLDADGNPTDRLWEAAAILRDRRIPAGGALVETLRFRVPPSPAGPLTIRAAVQYRAAAGYLGALMTTYLGADVPVPPAVEVATAVGVLPVITP